MNAAVHSAVEVVSEPRQLLVRQVRERRFIVPLILVVAGFLTAGLAVAMRWDPSTTVTADLARSGELQRVTEQELVGKIETARRLNLVMAVVSGVFGVPLLALLMALLIKLASWLVDCSASFAGSLTLAVYTLIPKAFQQGLLALAVLRQEAVDPRQLPTFVPSHLGAFWSAPTPILERLASSFDLFNLLSVWVLGTGIAAVSGMKAWRGHLVALLMFIFYAALFVVALPSTGAGR